MPPKKLKSKKLLTKKSAQSSTLCEKAILETLAYSAIFNYPLSFFQICTRLHSSKYYTFYQLQSTLEKLLKQRKVKRYFDRFCLSSVTRPVGYKYREQNTKKILADLAPYFTVLEKIPWIQFLAITGSTAAFNASPKDDVDIFIIVKNKRLWLTRFFVVLYLKVLEIYRTNTDFAGKICPNLFVTEANMLWDKKARNIYVATEIVLMYPIINRNDVYFKFLKKNSWINDFFYLNTEFGSLQKNINEESGLTDFFEKICMKLQIRYMNTKKTTEITSKHIIHFNKNDSAPKILDKFSQISLTS